MDARASLIGSNKVYDTEEEQIEAIKKWWSQNGNFVIGALIAALIAYFGWNFYQSSVQTQREAASEVYGNLLTLVETEDGTAEERNALISTLKSEYDDTPYAVYGALQGAKDAVERDDLSAALTELNWALEHASAELKPVIRVRKARVLFADDQMAESMATLETIDSEGFGVVVDELKGDILAAQGETDAARAAYQRAIDQAQEQGVDSAYLKMKLDDLSEPTDDA